MLLVSLVALVAVAAVAWPLLTDHAPREAPEGRPAGQDLDDALDRELQAIREITFDHRAGNLSDADFAELDAAARASAADLLRRREQATGRSSTDAG